MTDTAMDPNTMTIGPVGYDIPLQLVDDGKWSGDTVTVAGSFGPAEGFDLVEALALRDQLQGLASLTQRLQPVRFAGTPALDGLYEVGDPQISTDGASFAHGMFDWSVRLTRPRTWQQMVQQERRVAAVRSQPDGTANAHSIDGDDIVVWHSPGVAPIGYALSSSVDTVGAIHAGSEGPVSVFTDDTLTDTAARWQVLLPDFYRGSCRIMQSPDSSPRYYRVVGGQMENLPNNWALSNSLVAVRPEDGRLRFSWWDAAADRWVSKLIALGYDDGEGTGVYDPGFVLVRVVRETPERASLRLVVGSAPELNTAPAVGITNLDLSIERGSRFVDVMISGRETSWGLIVVDDEDLTSHTGGFHATAADPDGNKLIINSPQDLAGGAPVLDAPADRAAFGVGLEVGHTPTGFDAENFTSATWRWFSASFGHCRPVLA